jgi:hypothetical protein
MRCLMCGDDMVLTAAIPAEAGGVQGFETQTHQCPACRGTERRFIFVGRNTDFREGGSKTATLARAAHPIKGNVSHHVNGAHKTPVHPRSSINVFAAPPKQKSGSGHERLTVETTVLTSEPPLIEKVTELSDDAPGQAWVRAVEKFRKYEADLHRRVEKTKNTNGNTDTIKASDRIAIAPNDQKCLVNYSHHAAAKGRLHRQPCHAEPLEKAGLDHEALRRFDEFWDNLVPRGTTQKPAELSVMPASLAALPRSVSLAMIESETDPGNKIAKRVFKKMLQKVLHCLEGALP